MHTSSTRRGMRRNVQKRARLKRTFAALTAAGVAGMLTLGTTSMAMAADTPAGDENVSATQVEAPSPEVVTPPVVEEAPAAEAPAPVENVPAPPPPEPAPAPVVDDPEPQAPVAPVPVEDNTPSEPAPAVPTPESNTDSNKQVAPASTSKEDKGTDKGKDKDKDKPKKVFVCKYVGTPGDERLQTGNNPISVSVNAIQNNTWDGTVPAWFSDAHNNSFVLAYDTGQPKPSVSECPPPPKPEEPEPTCVDNATWSYTFDDVGSGTVTVSAKDAKQGDELCDALAVRAATYEYDRPASGKPSWPQTLVGYNDVLVDSIGSFSYATPALDVCRQNDIYAAFVSNGGFEALAVAEKLNGPNDPYEPKHLHATLAGKGPNPTWSITSSDGCNQPPEEPEPSTGTATFQTLSCEEGSKNWVDAPAVPGGVWVFTDEFGNTYRAPMGEAYVGDVPEELIYGQITVSLEQGDTTDYVVTPWSGTWVAIDPEWLDCDNPPEEPPLAPGNIAAICVGDTPWLTYSLGLPDGYPLPNDKPLTITFFHPTDISQDYQVTGLPLAGEIMWPGASDGSDGTAKQWPGWELNDDGNYVETDGNYRWTREGVTVFFQVNGSVYWTTVNYLTDDEICANPPKGQVVPPTNPPTNPPTDKPTPPTTPVDNPTPPVNSDTPVKPKPVTKVVVAHKPPAQLAETGTPDIVALMGAISIGLILVGGAFFLARGKRWANKLQ